MLPFVSNRVKGVLSRFGRKNISRKASKSAKKDLLETWWHSAPLAPLREIFFQPNLPILGNYIA